MIWLALAVLVAVIVTTVAWALCAHAGHLDDQDGRGNQ